MDLAEIKSEAAASAATTLRGVLVQQARGGELSKGDKTRLTNASERLGIDSEALATLGRLVAQAEEHDQHAQAVRDLETALEHLRNEAAQKRTVLAERQRELYAVGDEIQAAERKRAAAGSARDNAERARRDLDTQLRHYVRAAR